MGSARIRPGQIKPARRAPEVSAHQLGAGLTTVAPEPLVDPQSVIMTDPVLPENQRLCPSCGAPVGRSSDQTPGRLEGYCPKCRQPFSFIPRLSPGDLVAGQYSVVGLLAHGGMGWVYLARDRNVSDRWVVLKGLLNQGDSDQVQAALAEQRFLAQIAHPSIVEIYNFVTHNNSAYIVMEFVGGRSVKQILKDRQARAGHSDPLPVDQALSYIIDILPAFAYLHQRGLLYCDFKPDNLIHVEDSVKLIDMGGVRRSDDDESPIFGTIGFQAPEVASQGCSVASDIYTIGRTLLICCATVPDYQTTLANRLPTVEQTLAFQRYESLQRLIAKACAPDPADRFNSCSELQQQMIGVLRQVVAADGPMGAHSSAISPFFDLPTAVTDSFSWRELPSLKPVGHLSDQLRSLESLPSSDQLSFLLAQPKRDLNSRIIIARLAIESADHQLLHQIVEEILDEDPWQWRAAWLEGLGALNSQDWGAAQALFEAVYSQIPGEIAPQFALALAYDQAGQVERADQLYERCTRSDAAYVAAAAFGLARVRAKNHSRNAPQSQVEPVIQALQLVPRTSGGWQQSLRLQAHYLTQSAGTLPELQRAWSAVHQAAMRPEEALRLELTLYRRALDSLPKRAVRRPPATANLGGVALSRRPLSAQIDRLLRRLAASETSPDQKAALIDQANQVRRWSLW
jgi:serine/threonine-protein kinase PknG